MLPIFPSGYLERFTQKHPVLAGLIVLCVFVLTYLLITAHGDLLQSLGDGFRATVRR